MSNVRNSVRPIWWKIPAVLFGYPLRLLAWPLVRAWQVLHRNFLSYLFSRVLRDENRIYSVKFIWYGDSVYLHPMIWGSLILFLLAQTVVGTGWLLLLWFIGLFICYMTVMYNFNVVRSSILATGVLAFLGATYFSTIELAWNPLAALARHVAWLNADVTPGFFLGSAYFFAALICFEVIWAWLFHRVEIDESYVYEHQFLSGTTREPIFARGLKRETKDLLELLLLGAADIQHRTKKGVKRFKNVPFASLWLGSALDAMLDYRRRGQVIMERKLKDDEDDQVRIEDAFQEADWENEAEEADDFGDDADFEEDADEDGM